MDEDQIQKMLDAFDTQLASGQIDLATYQVLTRKWEAKSSRIIPAAPPGPLMIVIQCPKCGGPPDETLVPGRPYVCHWCSKVYTQEVAQAKTERPRRELQSRLNQFASGLGTGGAVDATARAFIFREKLCPELELEFNRSVEWLDRFREYPLFQVRTASRFRDYSGEASPIRQDDSLQPIRDLTAKLNAPIVREFVVAQADEQRLATIQMRASELIYTANASEQSSRFNADGYRAAAKNVVALKELYEEAVKIAPNEPARLFLQASLARVRGTETVLGVLVGVYSNNSPSWLGGPSAKQIEGALRYYEEALRIADASGYTPNETMPWRHGVEREMSAIRLECALLHCYDRASGVEGAGFPQFLLNLEHFLERAQPPSANPDELQTVLDSLASCVEAKRGAKAFPRLMDWSWLSTGIEHNRRKGFADLFGAKEVVENVDQYWQPFWLGRVLYSQAAGAIFKTGSVKQALVLLDSTSADSTAILVDQDARLHGAVTTVPSAEILDHRLSLPVLTGETRAQQTLQTLVRSNPGFPNAKVLVQALIYLPVARVTFRSKEGARVMVLSVVNQFSTQTDKLRLATAEFVQEYSTS